MNVGSPFGKYAQLVATITALAIVGFALVMHAIGQGDTAWVDNLAFIAVGAIFGAGASTAATNGSLGTKLTALHARLDAAGIPADGATTDKGGTP